MKTPNIILITTDEQRYDTIAAMGYDYMFTPNLDRLVREGCSYPHAYSNNPVCIPARHNIITGLTARYHGFDQNYFEENPRTIPYELPTFPQLLSDAGYDTMAIGKMHFQPCRRHNGFAKMELMEEIPRFLQDDEYAQYLKENGFEQIQSIHGVRHLLYMLPQRSLIDEEHHGSSWVAARSISYLRENAGKRPFFMWSSFIAPHPPFDVPEGWADIYKGKKLPPVIKSRTPISEQAVENRCIADYPNDKYLQRARELYYASISFADHNIGKILDVLKEIGEYDNTLIIFTSDHGEMMGDCGTFQKSLPYDGAARIPFIVRYPGHVAAGSTDSRFVDLNDILPTILHAAGLEYPNPERLMGESILKKDGVKNRNVQYIEYGHGNRRWISLRNERYKYNYYYAGGKEELFDMERDPHETTNLLWKNPSSDIEEVSNELKRQLTEIEAKNGLEGGVKDGKLIVFEEYEKSSYRENNPPIFSKRENIEYISLEEEVKRAISKEETVKLEELDILYFEEHGTLNRDSLF